MPSHRLSLSGIALLPASTAYVYAAAVAGSLQKYTDSLFLCLKNKRNNFGTECLPYNPAGAVPEGTLHSTISPAYFLSDLYVQALNKKKKTYLSGLEIS
jgi:hypothetical protein